MEAILDVESHAAERLHQAVDVERVIRVRGEMAEEARPQRRLHQRLKALVEVLGCLRSWRFGVDAHGSVVVAGGGVLSPR